MSGLANNLAYDAVCIKALRALGESAGCHATEVAEILVKDTAAKVRAAAAGALGAMGADGRAHIEKLQAALEAEDDDGIPMVYPWVYTRV